MADLLQIASLGGTAPIWALTELRSAENHLNTSNVVLGIFGAVQCSWMQAKLLTVVYNATAKTKKTNKQTNKQQQQKEEGKMGEKKAATFHLPPTKPIYGT